MENQNSNLHNAKVEKNDEFYTSLTDIEKELKHYKKYFKNKVVFCNCDDPQESNFWKYFAMNFEHLGLKKLISTHYIYSDLFTDDKRSYKLEITYGIDVNDDGKINNEDAIKTYLKQDGDFRNQECIDILKECDIVVTNPPFSLFREYVAQLIKYDKKFLIIGSDNAITYKDIFPLLKDNKMWLGVNKVKQFVKPCGKIKKFGNIGWYTNLHTKKRNDIIILYKKYSKKDYSKYDNYDAIEVSKVKDIPMDYDGVMGVPITFMDKYNPEQFEIIGLFGDARVKSDALVQGKSIYVDEQHKNYVGPVFNHKATYRRILIRYKTTKKGND